MFSNKLIQHNKIKNLELLRDKSSTENVTRK